MTTQWTSTSVGTKTTVATTTTTLIITMKSQTGGTAITTTNHFVISGNAQEDPTPTETHTVEKAKDANEEKEEARTVRANHAPAAAHIGIGHRAVLSCHRTHDMSNQPTLSV